MTKTPCADEKVPVTCGACSNFDPWNDGTCLENEDHVNAERNKAPPGNCPIRLRLAQQQAAPEPMRVLMVRLPDGRVVDLTKPLLEHWADAERELERLRAAATERQAALEVFGRMIGALATSEIRASGSPSEHTASVAEQFTEQILAERHETERLRKLTVLLVDVDHYALSCDCVRCRAIRRVRADHEKRIRKNRSEGQKKRRKRA